MKNCKTWVAASILGALLCLGGCGTISFFPYESAAKAADKVLDDILPGNGGGDEHAKVSEAKKP
jgi:hypothetical protein